MSVYFDLCRAACEGCAKGLPLYGVHHYRKNSPHLEPWKMEGDVCPCTAPHPLAVIEQLSAQLAEAQRKLENLRRGINEF
jgi:hypothetical protein